MRVKIFQIRLTDEHQQTDQDRLNNFMEMVTVRKTANHFVDGQPNSWSVIVYYEPKPIPKQDGKTDKNISVDKDVTSADTPLTTHEKEIFETLRQWRQDRANELNLPSYVICSNAELTSIAKIKPQTVDDLAKIKGFGGGGQKVAKYGEDIIAVLNSV